MRWQIIPFILYPCCISSNTVFFFFFITFQYEIVGNVFHWHTLHLQYRWSILDNAYVPNEFFFTVEPYHDPLFIVIFLLDLLAFFIANPLFRDRGKFVYSADNCLILRTDPLRLSFAFASSWQWLDWNLCNSGVINNAFLHSWMMTRSYRSWSN